MRTYEPFQGIATECDATENYERGPSGQYNFYIIMSNIEIMGIELQDMSSRQFSSKLVSNCKII